VSEAREDALMERYETTSTRLRERLLSVVTTMFDRLPGLRDDQAAAFVAQVVPVVLGAQAQMGALTDAYLAQMMAEIYGGSALPAGVQLAESLRGVPPEEVYRRPFVTAYTALSHGADFTTARQQAQNRLVDIASTDMQLARTHATRQALSADDRAKYFRRVLRGSKSCGMCTIASTQRYRKERLMPIHPGCNCGVKPLPGREDPGHIIDHELLEAAHDAIADKLGRIDRGGRTPDYRKLILTREHGEYGPTLTVRRLGFTGPGDLPG